jgi:hypothetical protein
MYHRMLPHAAHLSAAIIRRTRSEEEEALDDLAPMPKKQKVLGTPPLQISKIILILLAVMV